MNFEDMVIGKKYKVTDVADEDPRYNTGRYEKGDILILLKINGCSYISDNPDEECGRCQGEGRVERIRQGISSTFDQCITEGLEVEVEEYNPSWKDRLINDG